ncbi:MAG: aryl-sulfate sulfotransferase [Candidatus Thermoplasmatota archaeon]|nr:aryl-sulfate sulfotransferase [Candidatus Thermoplasmatota archaeon]
MGSLIAPLVISKTDDNIMLPTPAPSNGLILFSPLQDTSTYLIDKQGSVKHTWTSSYKPGQVAYLLEGYSILYATRRVTTPPAPGGAGGGVQIIEADGSISWDFSHYGSDYLSHHDIEPLPNGNVLMIVWEYKTRSEAIAAGRNPTNLMGDTLMSEYIIEVKPTGQTTGDIVWKWSVWDHLIQDYDPLKDNYGIVPEHPELIDINYGFSQADWLHCNAIDYNPEYDQILLSIRDFCEIWVIDHSTTTGEASGHTGGNNGQGGDILYRWGNPQAYRAGTPAQQQFYSQHDAQWIPEDYPGAGHILVFNNGLFRPDGWYSSVDEIVPPIDSTGNYFLTPGEAYEPTAPFWKYTAQNPQDFYAGFTSGCQRLPDGNTLICDGPAGRLFEVTPEKVIVWEYTNPYPYPLNNGLFTVRFYEIEEQSTEPDLDCEGSLSWTNIKTGETVEGNFTIKNIGGSNSLLDWEISVYPSWGTWSFTKREGYNLTPNAGSIIIDVTVIAPNERNTEFFGEIRIQNIADTDDFDVVPVYLRTPKYNNIILQNVYICSLQLASRYPIFRVLLPFFI